MGLIFPRCSQRLGGTLYTCKMHILYCMCEILVDWKFIAQFVRSQVTELTLKMRLLKNFSTKRGSFSQFLIRIRIQDTDPDPNPGFESGVKTNCRPDPDPKLDPKLLIRIRNTDKRTKNHTSVGEEDAERERAYF